MNSRTDSVTDCVTRAKRIDEVVPYRGGTYIALSDYRPVKSSGSITQKFMVGVTEKVACSHYFSKRGAGENPSSLWVI